VRAIGSVFYLPAGSLSQPDFLDHVWTDLPAASPFQLSPIGEKGFFRVKVNE